MGICPLLENISNGDVLEVNHNTLRAFRKNNSRAALALEPRPHGEKSGRGDVEIQLSGAEDPLEGGCNAHGTAGFGAAFQEATDTFKRDFIAEKPFSRSSLEENRGRSHIPQLSKMEWHHRVSQRRQ